AGSWQGPRLDLRDHASAKTSGVRKLALGQVRRSAEDLQRRDRLCQCVLLEVQILGVLPSLRNDTNGSEVFHQKPFLPRGPASCLPPHPAQERRVHYRESYRAHPGPQELGPAAPLLFGEESRSARPPLGPA